MKIENMGVRITDVPGVERLEVLRGEITIHWTAQANRFPLSDVAQIRNALDAALEEHAKLDTVMTTPNTATFQAGQVLDGTEDLPIGTVVRDSDRCGPDTWTNQGDRWVTADGDYASRESWPGTVRRYGPVTIKSLP